MTRKTTPPQSKETEPMIDATEAPIVALVPTGDPDLAAYNAGYKDVPDAVRDECEQLWEGIQRTTHEVLRNIRDKLAPYGTFKDWCTGHGVNYHSALVSLSRYYGNHPDKQSLSGNLEDGQEEDKKEQVEPALQVDETATSEQEPVSPDDPQEPQTPDEPTEPEEEDKDDLDDEDAPHYPLLKKKQGAVVRLLTPLHRLLNIRSYMVSGQLANNAEARKMAREVIDLLSRYLRNIPANPDDEKDEVDSELDSRVYTI